MIFTNDRLSIGEVIYPSEIGNQISILSSSVVDSKQFTISGTFALSLWLMILFTYVFCITANVFIKYITYKKSKKYMDIKDIIINLILSHFLVLIGKRK